MIIEKITTASVFVGTAGSLTAILTAWNLIGTSILVTISVLLAIHKVKRVFFGSKKDKKDDDFSIH